MTDTQHEWLRALRTHESGGRLTPIGPGGIPTPTAEALIREGYAERRVNGGVQCIWLTHKGKQEEHRG